MTQTKVSNMMNCRWRRYGEYSTQASGRLPDLPSHWTVRRLKYLARFAGGGTPATGDSEYWNGSIPWVSPKDMKSFRIADSEDHITEAGLQNSSTQIVPPGSVLIVARSGILKHSIPVAINVSPVALNQDMKAVLFDSSSSLLPEFLAFFVNGLQKQLLLQWKKDGATVESLDLSLIANTITPLPSLAEQREIVRFLARETMRIDSLILQKSRLRELLMDRRDSLVWNAISHGVKSFVRLVDSRIPWLGSIPEHWSVRRIKYVAKLESGHTPDKKVEAYWTNCDIPWVSLNDTGYLKDHDYISETAFQVNQLGLQNSSARLLPERAVVFSRDATIGRCAITTRPMAVSQHFIAWLCHDPIIPEFLLYVLRAMRQELERLTMGATIKTIGMPDVRNLWTPVPPVEEQKEIVRHIQQRCFEVDQSIQLIDRGIDRLGEYRSALISAAVTGQIDVRGEEGGG